MPVQGNWLWNPLTLPGDTVVQGSSGVALRVREFNVRAFRAKGDGVTDDSPAFQDAITAALAARGTVVIPPAESGQFYNLATTVIIQPSSGAQAWVNIEGHAGPQGIRWTGGSKTAVFALRGLKYGRWSGVHVLLGSQANVAVFDIQQVTGVGSSGTTEWHNCLVGLGAGDTNQGWRFGAALIAGGESSFHSWHDCVVSGGTTDREQGHTAWQCFDGNGLVYEFTNCTWSGVTWGLSTISPLTLLNGAIDAVQATLTVDSTVGFPSSGRVQIASEQIDYTGRTTTTLTGCTRGVNGTTAVSAVDNQLLYLGIQNPVTSTYAFALSGGNAHTFVGCGGSFNKCEFLTKRSVLTVVGGRWEQGKRLLQIDHTGSTNVLATFQGVAWGIVAQAGPPEASLPADGIVIALGLAGDYTFDTCQFYGTDYTAATVTAGVIDGFAGPTNTPNMGSIRFTNNEWRAAGGTTSPITAPPLWRKDTKGTIRVNTVGQSQEWVDGGHRTEGVANVADGGTITHNLGRAPSKYGATATVAGEFPSITATSTTTLTVSIKKHDGTAGTTQNIAWWAEV